MSYVVWRVADALAKQNLPNVLGNLAANVHVLAVGRIQLLAKLAKVETTSCAAVSGANLDCASDAHNSSEINGEIHQLNHPPYE